MVSRMASRLAGARNVAEQAGLEGTAERLELLRKELSALKDLPDARRAEKASWALAKMEETRRCMESEARSPKEALRERQARHDARALLAKTALCAGSVLSGFRALLSDPDHPVLLVSGFIVATVVMAGIIDHLIGARDEMRAAERIGDTLEDSRRSLSGAFRNA